MVWVVRLDVWFRDVGGASSPGDGGRKVDGVLCSSRVIGLLGAAAFGVGCLVGTWEEG